MAQPWNLEKLRFSGEPFVVEEQVGYSNIMGGADFSVSQNVLVYDPSGSGLFGQEDELAWFDRRGNRLGTADEPGVHYQPWLSPDGQQLAVDRLDPQTRTPDIWLIDLKRGISARLTFDAKNDWYPVWSPDGSRIVFSSDREGMHNLYQKVIRGTGKEELLLKSDNAMWPSDWSLDGQFVLYYEFGKTLWDVGVLPLARDAKPISFLRTEFNEWKPVMSPDGRWIAYESDESGKYEVYVRPFPAAAPKWQVSKGGGRNPKFRRDGKELFYLGADRKMMAVQVQAGATFQSGIPEPLFDTRITNEFVRYAVSPDGQRFFIPTPLGETVGSPATVVLNWTARLK
jgi:dipeptidyl aminopeptidase/acylaminoacyl peptidase